MGGSAFTAKAISVSLASPAHRKDACRMASSLLVAYGNLEKVFGATRQLLEPLLVILPDEPAASGPLAVFAQLLTMCAAYPEAATCIDAIIERTSDVPLDYVKVPWAHELGVEMTWPMAQALLWLWRGEGRLASVDREGGDAALAEGMRRAQAAGMPTPIGIIGSGPFMGSVADRALWARVKAAEALRLRYEGKDPCCYRKVKKPKASAKPDRALLELAREYLDDVLAVTGPRIATQYAGLVPRAEGKAEGWVFELTRHQWQRFAYFESALVDEHLGNLERARIHLGRAKWLSALENPSHQHEYKLQEAVARLAVDNVPLA